MVLMALLTGPMSTKRVESSSCAIKAAHHRSARLRSQRGTHGSRADTIAHRPSCSTECWVYMSSGPQWLRCASHSTCSYGCV